MITKAQERTLRGSRAASAQPRLSALERAMLRWTVTDPDDKVLDANVGTGVMADYLRRNLQCEVCGVSENMEDVRVARSRLQSCDIVYAAAGDIPWREGAFDAVLLKQTGDEPETLARVLGEVKRVLKPGGQLTVGMVCFPAPMQAVLRALMPESGWTSQLAMEKRLSELGFEKVRWQRTGLNIGVLTAWKHLDEERVALACEDDAADAEE